MLDANLPTFFLKPFAPNSEEAIIHLSQDGQDAAPAYTVRRPDPTLQTSKNCYSVALFDSYNPEILYGEVYTKPEWTQPSLSAEEIRRNGGVPPPPQPIIPTEFVIQLYAPDQQVRVRQKQGSWGGSAYWEFELPQRSFREPSASSLDRSLSDPAAAATTPKLTFHWKKDGKLSKDLVCSLSGKNSETDGGKKKSSRDPDIAISLFKHLKEVTIYEPNLYRVDLEDFKGLEVVLLLSAAVIKDMWFANVRESFNLVAPQTRSNGEQRPKPTSPTAHAALGAPPPPLRTQPGPQPHQPRQNGRDPRGQNPRPTRYESQPPPADARTQWEIDAETARLRKQVDAETRERERAEEAERRRIKKMVETEDKAERRRRAEVEKETERLRRAYAAEDHEARRKTRTPQAPPRVQTQSLQPPVPPRPQSVPHPSYGQQHPWRSQGPSPSPYQGPYLQPLARPEHASSSGFFNPPAPSKGDRLAAPKRNIFGLRARSDDQNSKLSKKRSSLF
ncbi:MAG: hypothetical protein M4579_000396 [Chaenotheca gracillima]|nr:MAG: hypothetical protein M4579_000396 [Chaenotheca gracillima]